MRLTDARSSHNRAKPVSPRSERVNQLLVLVAFILMAALAALISDLWIWPVPRTAIVEAVAPASFEPDPSPTTGAPAAALPASTLALASSAVVTTPATPPACVPPSDWGIHLVQEGNSLDSLAKRYGTDVDTLMRVNCLNTFTIFAGQRLYVPGPSATPTPITPLSTSSATLLDPLQPGGSAAGISNMEPAPTPVPTAMSQTRFQVNIPNRYLNIVLLGSDKRPSSGAWRTDSMIVVSVDMEENIVRLLSIPRDLWVYIPGHGYNRINTADLWGELAQKGGGPERVKQTIFYNLGIPIHYYVRVDFQGFMKIIDAVGGVDIDVECPLPDIDLAAGMYHMNGAQALRYSRSRYSTNDFDRGRRQRKVLMALWEQGLTLNIIPKLPSLWWAMADSFETDLPLDQVINLAYIGVQLKPQRILSTSIGASQVQSWITPEGAAVLLPREDRIRTLLENFYAVKDTDNLDLTEKVQIRILNGSPRRQAEQLAASAVAWEGFKVVKSGSADRQDCMRTQISVYRGEASAGQELAKLLGVPASAVQDMTAGGEQPDPANPIDIQVILGADYNPCQR
jgi:LCP family protein required for cell wall assembly